MQELNDQVKKSEEQLSEMQETLAYKDNEFEVRNQSKLSAKQTEMISSVKNSYLKKFFIRENKKSKYQSVNVHLID